MLSAKPLVVMSPVLAPERVSSVLSPTVQPWKNSLAVCNRSSSPVMPRCSAALRTASRTPWAKLSGVDNALPTVSSPASSTTTQSVNVPPISTPRLYSMSISVTSTGLRLADAAPWSLCRPTARCGRVCATWLWSVYLRFGVCNHLKTRNKTVLQRTGWFMRGTINTKTTPHVDRVLEHSTRGGRGSRLSGAEGPFGTPELQH